MARFGRLVGFYTLEQEKRGFKRFTASRGVIVADCGGFYDQQQLFLLKCYELKQFLLINYELSEKEADPA